MRQDAKASSSAGRDEASSDTARHARAAAPGFSPGDRSDGRRDRLPPGRLAPNPTRSGHDPGGPAVVADPALRDAPVRLIEQPGNVCGEAPVAASQGDLDPVPEVLRGPSSPLRPELERAVARLVLGFRHTPQPGRGFEPGEVVVGLEEGSSPKTFEPGFDAVRREGGVHLQEAGPAVLPRKTVEPVKPHQIRHGRVGNGGEERLDRGLGVPAEPGAELEVPQPRMERVVPERCRQPVETLALALPESAPGLDDLDAFEGRPGDRRLRADGPGFGDGDWQERPKKEEDGETPAPGRWGGGCAVPPSARMHVPASSGPHRTKPSGPATNERTRTTEEEMERLTGLMARLRQDCPWDRVQTFETIAPCTIEEAYEVADAIAREDLDSLREELGDLLFQVVFHAHLANERGCFDIDDVIDTILDKMIRRHPHVFELSATGERLDWERAKLEQRPRSASALDGVPAALPPLARAGKLQRRAAAVGFDWPDVEGVFDKLDEEVAELREALDAGEGRERAESELGDLLFTCVNLARRLEFDCDRALAGANRRFERRFRAMERLAGRERRLDERTPAELDALWERAKEE